MTPENKLTAVSLPVCRLYCNEDVGTVWPKPTGKVQISNDIVKINPNDIIFSTTNFKKEPGYWTIATDRFIEMQKRKLPKKVPIKSGGKTLLIDVVVDTDDMTLDLDTFESYTFKITEDSNGVHVAVKAKNFYGARNALETLSQLIVYDNIRNEM